MRLTLRPLRLLKTAGLLAALVAVTGLAGCYVPVRFDAEIEIDRAGFYSMIFDGYMADSSLYQDLAEKKLSPEEEQRRAAVIIDDFKRDSAVSECKYYRQGIFKVHWAKKDDLMRFSMVTFFKRNEAILTLKYLKEKDIIVVSGASLSTSQRQQLADAGLNITGELRVITDARVLGQNATEVRDVAGKPGKKMYIWRIADLNARTPRLELQPG